MRPVTVLGAGAWGTALANLCARDGQKVHLWCRDRAHATEMEATRENRRRLPGVPLASGVVPVADMAAAAQSALILVAVPTQAVRAALAGIAPLVQPGTALVLCAKGIERETGLFPDEVAAQVAPRLPLAVLSGPSFAQDLALGLPTAVTLASTDPRLAEAIAAELAAPWFRLYTTSDVRGVVLGGAAKNVLAIASGIAAGRGLGASAGAALMARGFAELVRLGLALGARRETLAGLSGLGDLVLTCTSRQSRNFAHGFALGSGIDPVERGVVEGALTAQIIVSLAARHGIDMPIATAVDGVLRGALSVESAIDTLLARPLRGEGG